MSLLSWLVGAAALTPFSTHVHVANTPVSDAHDHVHTDIASGIGCVCSHRDLCEDGDTCGGITYSPSRGAFPHGCRWREVQPSNGTEIYEYWDDAEHVWVNERPSACTINVCLPLSWPAVPKDVLSRSICHASRSCFASPNFVYDGVTLLNSFR